MPTANEFEWIRRQRCIFCQHSQPTTGRGRSWCTLDSRTVQKNDCCARFRYNHPTHVYLTNECPIS